MSRTTISEKRIKSTTFRKRIFRCKSVRMLSAESGEQRLAIRWRRRGMFEAFLKLLAIEHWALLRAIAVMQVSNYYKTCLNYIVFTKYHHRAMQIESEALNKWFLAPNRDDGMAIKAAISGISSLFIVGGKNRPKQ